MIAGCKRFFKSTADAVVHVSEDHPRFAPREDKHFEIFKLDLDDIRQLREKAEEKRCKCCGEPIRWRFYRALASGSAFEYFRKRGLYPQVKKDLGYHRTSGSMKVTYTWGSKHQVVKRWAWWLLFLHAERGPILDKFITESMMDTHVSHICHWPPCLSLSDLELVLPYYNNDRTKCKNNERKYSGGCQAADSFHRHEPCFGPERKIGDHFPSQPEARAQTASKQTFFIAGILYKG